MPTVIALDVSLSMRRPILNNGSNENNQNEQLTRHHLAVHGINALLHYLQVNSKLEFVALVVFSSLYEVICPFTRDYDSIRSKLQNIEECDKTCIETALHGVNNVIMAEWGNTTACQVVLITDGNPGVGPMSLGYLKCGNLGSRVLLSPAPMPYTKKTDFELVSGLMISKTIEICGFISVADVGSPSAISRHLVLPLATEKSSSMQGISLEEDSDTDENGDEGKVPSFCVLLHGALKVENMVALCLLNNEWYGFIYSWADTKKKSNLMLTVLEPGLDVVPWLGNFSNLGPVDAAKGAAVSFPVRPNEKRSYTQNAPSWIRQVGLQSDIQKILRHARKLPEKTQNFYKEVNRLRRAAASMGFVELLEGLACILERECTLLPPNLNPDCTIQMGHVASMIRKPEFLELRYNIPPARTRFQHGGS
ncbi:integrator complex subunit 14 isoform X4 [Megachile rotundata]|uniref:integrator complex subunit 14 isoform X4 n=1 Tax=Megachile rotundata TaxID=143995 RepID=UPI00061528BE|nr:PREDICTED: von Willebrand factor A domain-containing protein 9 isoform X5 [Megachile rotundata]